NNKLKKNLFWIAEFLSYHLANARGAVSHKLISKLHKSFGKKPVFMMPCCISSVKSIEEVAKVKQHFKTDKFKFVYVGSVNKWQCFPEVLQLFQKISQSVSAELT